eukprot:1147312-Pelagomonas_calceolata.AAC.8
MFEHLLYRGGQTTGDIQQGRKVHKGNGVTQASSLACEGLLAHTLVNEELSSILQEADKAKHKTEDGQHGLSSAPLALKPSVLAKQTFYRGIQAWVAGRCSGQCYREQI